MGRAAGVIALLSVLACGGSSASQRGDEGPGDDVVGDVGGGESGDDSNAQNDDGGGGGAAADGAQADEGDPVEQAIAEDKAAEGKPPVKNSSRKYKTSESPEKMSAFLVKPAKDAMKAKKYPLAISLYSGLVAARGKDDDSALELAKAWNLAGQFEEAARVYSDFAETTSNDEQRVMARGEIDRLREFENPFSRDFAPVRANKEAREAFSLGRKAQKKKKWGDALFYFEVALALDPTLAGTVREIGSSYLKLGAKDDATKFYLDYLWRKPAGKFTKDVLKELKKLKANKKLGYLNVTSKLKCDEVWVEGQMVKGLPIKKKPMAPGRYTWLCYSGRYGMAYFETVRVEEGKTSDLEFTWAVVINEMQKPWGRIVLEDARKRGVMRDLGIDAQDFGVIVPKDGSALKMELKAPNGATLEERFVRIKPGETLRVKWKKQ